MTSGAASPPLVGAGIGVASGVNTERLLKFLNMRQLILIDPWERAIDTKTNDNNQKYIFQIRNNFGKIL